MPLDEKKGRQKKKAIQALRKKQHRITDKSLIIVHSGNGKGKTTAALGLIMRTIAHGGKAAMVQFMKSPKDFKYAERKLADSIENFDIFIMGAGFTWNTEDRALDIRTTQETWKKAVEIMESRKYDLVVLDEINYVIDYEFLDVNEVVGFLRQKPKKLHVVLTGRNAKAEVIELADLVTDMVNIKHPYATRGLLAQKGIDW